MMLHGYSRAARALTIAAASSMGAMPCDAGVIVGSTAPAHMQSWLNTSASWRSELAAASRAARCAKVAATACSTALGSTPSSCEKVGSRTANASSRSLT